MNSDQPNKWLTLVANISVLLGIGLVIFELNQTRESIRAQTRSELSSKLADLMSEVAANPQLAGLVRRVDDGEELTPDEEKQYGHRSSAMFRYFENVHYQYRQGLYDESEYLAQRKAWRVFFENSRTAAQNWCMTRDLVSPEFAEEIDSLLTSNPCRSL